MREHLVLSQFASGHPTARKNFPMRNRTMALISDASVIVEASDGSGNLSLMASIVDRSDLAWPRAMLDYGAMVLAKPEDLCSQLPEQIDDPFAVLA